MTDLEKYIIARWTYSLGTEWITNSEYTILHNMMKEKYPDNEYVNRSWSSDPCPVELLRKYDMKEFIKAVIITDKTESIPSLGSIYEVEELYKDLNEECTGSYKHDGWNIQYSYLDGKCIWAQTRGRASDAKECAALMDLVPATIPLHGKITVVCEGTVTADVFQYLKREFGNKSQRGSVSTLLARPDLTHLLSVHAFDIKGDSVYKNPFPILEDWGFQTPKWVTFSNYDDLLLELKKASDAKPGYPYPTDGWVVAGTITRAIRVLAWEEPIYKSFILEDNPYVEKFGAYRISIGCNIYPVSNGTGTQRVVPVQNIRNIVKNDLRPGYPIAFTMKSHAIADLDEASTALLRKEWDGKLDKYREQIKLIEASRNTIY